MTHKEPSELRLQPIRAWFNDTLWRPAKGYQAVKGRWVFVGPPVLLCAAVTSVFLVQPKSGREQEIRATPRLASPAPPANVGGWQYAWPTTATTPPPPTTAPQREQPKPRASRSAPHRTGGGWDALKQCEAGGSYDRNTGNGFYGAYQFDRGTWNSNNVAGGEWGSATPEQQDAAAQHLYAQRGSAPWPVCGRHLP